LAPPTINARRKKTGHFWQGRYGAAVMDEDHLIATFRYILHKHVEASLAVSPAVWRCSSAASYLKGVDDGLTETGPILQRVPNIMALLTENKTAFEDFVVRDDETIGRPRGDKKFLEKLEHKTGRSLKTGKRGPKPGK
jgi:putative transposase